MAKVKLALLAGLLCDDEVWRAVADLIADVADPTPFHFADFRSIASMAEHVLDQMEGPFCLGGHSMGGRVALEVHHRAPDRVKGLALLNTGIHPRQPHEPESRGRLVALARTSGMAALAEEWMPPMLDSAGAHDPQVIDHIRAMILRATPESFEAQIQALLDRPDGASTLAEVKVPTLLLSASGDIWSPPKQHHLMQQLVPHARLVIIADAGHMALMEQPEAVAAALRNWIQHIG